MTDPADEPTRLADAIDAFLRRDSTAETDSAYLDRHPELRDLLGPMLERETDDSAPQQIGPYRILGELGRGGMGVVYDADHPALRRRVALKVLPTLLSAWPRRVERFLREAMAVARLDHPGIVKVFDAGEADGVFYYAMERVDGGSVREALDEIRARCHGEPRQLVDAPQFGIAGCRDRIDEIAVIGIAIAEALAHAHQQGIVHRDVKPQNLLLGSDLRPRLVDFGLVKDLDDLASASREFAGTPHYASPEQIDTSRQPIDGRADVFGVGVVLYELAALRRPFDGASVESVVRAVLTDEPRSLRSSDPRIPRDFEAIVHRALEKHPSARYPTAAALASDLKRFRHGEPVRARRHSWVRKLSRWVLRHRAATSAIVLATLLVVGGPLSALWFSARSRAAIAAERDLASASFTAARRAVEQLLGRIDEEDLTASPHMQRFRLGLLQDASRGYDELLRIAGAAADPRLLRATGRTATSKGVALFDLGRRQEAVVAFTRAINLGRRLLDAAPDDLEARAMVARAQTARGLAGSATGDVRGAMRDFGAARDAWCEIQTSLAAGDARISSVLRGAASTEVRIADAMIYRDVATAASALDRAWAAVRALPSPLPAMDLAIELHLLTAELHLSRGEIGQHRALIAETEALAKAALARDPRSARLRGLAACVADARAAGAQDPTTALEAHRAAIATRTALVSDFPDVPAYRAALARAHDRLAVAFLLQGRLREAMATAEAGLELASALANDDPSPESRSGLARSQVTFGVVGSRLPDDPEFAEAMLDEAIASLQDLVTDAPHDLRLRSELGAALSNRGQIDLMRRRDPRTAGDTLLAAVEAQRAAATAAPNVATYRTFLTNHLLLLGEARLRANDASAALAALEEVRALVTGDTDRLVTVAAGLVRCLQLGEQPARDAALLTLEQAAAGSAGQRLAALAGDPRFRPIANEPRFQALIERMRRTPR